MSLISRKAFTLIELILVISLMGIIASLVSSRLASLADNSVTLTPATLKSYLSSFSSSKKLDLLCYDGCTQCDLWEGDKKIRTAITLENNTSLIPYRFSPYGRLIPADPVIRSDSEGIRQGCFTFSLTPDGVSSPLILKSEGNFIAYTPLTETIISGSEEHLRLLLYDPKLMDSGSYYGNW